MDVKLQFVALLETELVAPLQGDSAEKATHTKYKKFWPFRAVAISCNERCCAAVRGDCHVAAFGAAPRNDNCVRIGALQLRDKLHFEVLFPIRKPPLDLSGGFCVIWDIARWPGA